MRVRSMRALCNGGFLRPAASPAWNHSRQRGQAVVEGMVVALGLVVLWVAIAWLAHYQDAALAASHASRFAAFVATRTEPDAALPDLTAAFFTGAAYRWHDRKGKRVIDFEKDLRVVSTRLTPLSTLAQPAQDAKHGASLRRDWHVGDQGILQVQVHLSFPPREEALSPLGLGLLGLNTFDQAYPSLTRSTAILTGSGHAGSDEAVQTRLGDAQLAWASAHRQSLSAARAAEARAGTVDTAWNRPGMDDDWIFPWSGYVPEYYLLDYERQTAN